MRVCSLELSEFRNYSSAELEFGAGLNVIIGGNGQGKTNLLEAIGFAGGLGSVRGITTPDMALVREGADYAIIRCRTVTDADREVMIEAQIFPMGRNRVQINGQRIFRQRDLGDSLVLSIFSPGDLELVKGGPAKRRGWIDAAAVRIEPQAARKHDELKRILRQRNALLRQTAGRLDSSAIATLDIWDDRLAVTGDAVRRQRQNLLDALRPRLNESYEKLAGRSGAIAARYESSWGEEPLAEALRAVRATDVKRAVSTVGPHRDDIRLLVEGRSARVYASQGEQRCVALAMRLAVDAEIRERCNLRTVLLLDDVFSELDAARSASLLGVLPEGQCILATASDPPDGFEPEQTVRVSAGTLSVRSAS